MDKNHALRVNKETIETTLALLDQLAEMSKSEAFHFNRQTQAIIKTVLGMMSYENSDWDIDERYQGLVKVIDSLFDYIPLDYAVCRSAVIAKYLNSAEQFDPEVRDMVAKHFRLKRMKDRIVPTWYYD